MSESDIAKQEDERESVLIAEIKHIGEQHKNCKLMVKEGVSYYAPRAACSAIQPQLIRG